MSSPALYLIAAAVAWSACLHAEPLPVHLRDTGLYAGAADTQIDARNRAFSPQYPLWSDGASKRRWIYLPPGTAIDASRPDAWEFPPGTRLWKEFSLGRPVETRFIERRADGAWRYAVYVWNEEGTDATLAPADGIAALAAHGAPRDGYSIPSELDCRACHESAAVPVLGFSALQLSSDRDPLAPHADARTDIDLDGLVARGLIKNLTGGARPRIEVSSPIERATLGYLHGNCGHCHNDTDTRVPVDLTLAQSVAAGAAGADRVLRSLISVRSRFTARISSRNPQKQMPPIGTRLIDSEALALIERWIAQETFESSPTPEELQP
jgi:mono/diheme cytochrome c family protein